jgi:hypothetical protein
LFGTKPWTNVNIDSFLPPEVSPESASRFFWRYLTAFQYRTWRQNLWEPERKAALQPPSSEVPTNPQGVVSTSQQPRPLQTDDSAAPQQSKPVNSGASAPDPATTKIVIRPDIEHQFALLREFVRVCEQNAISLTIAAAPLKRTNGTDLNEVHSIVRRIAEIAPIWDFSPPGAATDPLDLWLDGSHFSRQVGSMMIERIYDGTPKGEFGELIHR